MKVLGIETTCDETAASVVVEGRHIISSVVSSQIDLHKAYGGVVPELACRRHIDLLMPIIDEALKQANTPLSEIDLISVAHGPGLIGALMIGLNAAKALSFANNIPFIGVNHIEAHLYACLMANPSIPLPAIGAILSGGHTTLVHIKSLGEYDIIGETVDDAIGEAFDKCSKIMGLSYPGGPIIENMALRGSKKHPFKAGQVKGKPLAFSFSGLKTAVLYAYRKIENPTEQDKNDIAASFQHAAFTDIQKKIGLAMQDCGTRTLLVGGGVTNSQALKSYLTKFDTHYPDKGMSLDNAAMIAGLGFHKFKGTSDPYSLKAIATLPIV